MKLEKEIINWALERNIIGPEGKATKLSQFRKTSEEVNELLEAIELDNKELAIDAIGDIYVTLALQAQLWDSNMDECVRSARPDGVKGLRDGVEEYFEAHHSTGLDLMSLTYDEMASLIRNINSVIRNINSDNKLGALRNIGYIYCSLYLQAKAWDVDIDDCIEAAWNEIKDRQGKMIDGVFVKDN